MTNNSNLEELMAALELIRSEQYPDLSRELLESLLAVEYEDQDNRASAQQKCLKVLDDFLEKLID